MKKFSEFVAEAVENKVVDNMIDSLKKDLKSTMQKIGESDRNEFNKVHKKWLEAIDSLEELRGAVSSALNKVK